MITIEVGCGKGNNYCKCGGVLGPRCKMVYAELQYEYDRCIVFPDHDISDEVDILRLDACKALDITVITGCEECNIDANYCHNNYTACPFEGMGILKRESEVK